MVVVPPITVRTQAGDEYPVGGLQAWREHPYGEPDTQSALALPADLNAVLSAQHLDSGLADPAQYELLAAVVGSTDADVSLSPLVRGEAGAAGLLRLWSGELAFDSVVAMLVEREEDAD